MEATSPLISPEELASLLGDPGLRIADVRWTLNQPERGLNAYRAGHIAGAIFVDLDTDLAAAAPGPYPQGGRHPLPDPVAFARRLGQLGFGSGHRIVAYDDSGGTVAARLWWMLDDLGHERVQLLNGGLAAWTALGLPLSTAADPHPATGMHLRNSWMGTISREGLARQLGKLTLLDVRAPERYRGDVEPVDRVPGHIPTARNLPTTGHLNEAGRFRPPGELAFRFAAAVPGEAARDVVVACGSGVNAAHTALAMRVAGLPDPILYAGSYSDWSAAGLPIVTGDEPGEPPRSEEPKPAPSR